LYDPDEIELAPNPFRPKNAYSKALTDFGEIRVYEGVPEKGPIDDALAKTLKHGYFAAVTFIDACVGKILDELNRLQLEDDTIVVLWGDHGWKLGEHACWCKHTNVRLDTNAPLLVAAPNQKAPGEKLTAPVDFVDIYPALCDLAGLDKPDHLQGDSFAPLMDDPNGVRKRAAFSQYPRGSVMGYSMTTERFRYTAWIDQKKNNQVVFTELYDHLDDPQENENVAGDPRYASDLQRLEQWHREGWQGTRRAFWAGQ
jgi:arylsulfatase A-like enzyme